MGPVIAKCRSQPQTGESGEPEAQVEAPRATRQKKRFNPFFQPNFQSSSQVNLHERYKFITHYEDRFLGTCTVIQQLESGNLFLLKEHEYKSDIQCRQAVERLKNKKLNQQDCEGLLRIVEVFGKRVDGLVNNFSKTTIIMEYPLLSLKREFNHRLLNKTEFSTNEIADVVFSTIKAYAFLERTGCINDKVRMAHIFVGVQSRTKESKVKVIDSDLLQVKSNYQCMLTKGSEFPQNHDIYLAPEQFAALVEKKQSPPQEDRNKAAVFSLGASILDLCVMSSSFEFYHYHNKQIKKPDVRGLINVARKRHGLLLFKLLTQMLQFQIHKRPTFAELQVLINKPLGQSEASGSALRLSTVKDVNTKYLQVTRHSTGNFGKVSEASLMSASMADRQFCKGGEYAMEEEEQLVNMHEEYTNGNQYIGQKKNDLKHGKGKYIFNDRSYYQGWWKDDLMHGEGQLFFPNGKVEYQGEWANGEPNGWGILYAPQDFSTPTVWTRYQGEMRNGEMHGRGKLFFVEGTIYEGQFQNGKIFGRGCRIDHNGDIIEKEWELTPLKNFVGRPQDKSILPDRRQSQQQI